MMRLSMTASMVAARYKRHAERKAASSTLQPDLSARNRSSIRQQRRKWNPMISIAASKWSTSRLMSRNHSSGFSPSGRVVSRRWMTDIGTGSVPGTIDGRSKRRKRTLTHACRLLRAGRAYLRLELGRSVRRSISISSWPPESWLRNAANSFGAPFSRMRLCLARTSTSTRQIRRCSSNRS